MSRQTEFDANVARLQLEACIAACKSYGAECEQLGQRSQRPRHVNASGVCGWSPGSERRATLVTCFVS